MATFKIFDPTKRFENDTEKEDASVIWSTPSIEMAEDSISKGMPLKVSPFVKNNPQLRKPKLLFQYSDMEMSEIMKCATDINHFAEKYCMLKTKNGIAPITLRKYQKRMLNDFQNERFNIVLSSRQIGKCITPDTEISVRFADGKKSRLPIYQLYFKLKQDAKTPFERSKLMLYSKLLKAKGKFKYEFYLKLIRYVEMFEYIDWDLDEFDPEKKIMDTIVSAGIEVLTETGYEPIKEIHLTQPYTVYEMRLENGMILRGADEHRVSTRFGFKFMRHICKGDNVRVVNGFSPVLSVTKKRTKVCMYDLTVDSKNHTYFTNGILSHNTTTTAIFVAWYLIFNGEKTIGILGNKGATGIEVLGKVKSIIVNLPFFLKPGIEGWNVTTMTFDNECKAITRATTVDSLQGLAIDCLFLDEFAYVRENLQNPFWENVYPTISSMDNSKIIITSTPNGKNLFFELWNKAVKKISTFNPIRVDWWEVPDRDEEWKKQEISNIGESAFNQQYGLSFDVTAEQLIGSATMQWVSNQINDFVDLDMSVDEKYDKYFRWNNGLTIDTEMDYVLFSVDIAEGLGGEHDYSTIQMLRMTYNKEYGIHYQQIGVFECNTIPTQEFAELVGKLIMKFDQDKCKLLVERNTYGELFFYIHDTLDHIEIELETYVKFKPSLEATNEKKGLRTNKEIKKISVSAYKVLLETCQLHVQDLETVKQIENFQKNAKGQYCAQVGHDDLVMPLVNASYFLRSANISLTEWVEDFREERNLPDDATKNVFGLLESLRAQDDDIPYEELSAEARALMDGI